MCFRTFAPRACRLAGPLLLVSLVSACATGPGRVADPRDPLEPYNRAVYRFNSDFDKAFLRPVAKGYRAITPEPVNRGITNFFNNLWDITSLVNNALQFKMARAGSDLGRLVMNSTVGVAGFVDVATNAGLTSYKEDFGQTLGYWGMSPGAYVILPILGPKNIRDTLGLAGDLVTDPLFSLNKFFGLKTVRHNTVFWGLAGVRIIDLRADNLEAGEILNDAALDPYVFLRDAYMQQRHNLVYDGNPPEAETQEDIWADVDFKDGSDKTPKPRSNPSPTKPAASGPAGQ